MGIEIANLMYMHKLQCPIAGDANDMQESVKCIFFYKVDYNECRQIVQVHWVGV